MLCYFQMYSKVVWLYICVCMCVSACVWVSLVAQMVKNLSAMQEMRVLFLGGEYPLEKGMATHSSILGCRIPWIEEPGWL